MASAAASPAGSGFVGRIIALLLGIGIVFFMVTRWGDDFNTLFAESDPQTLARQTSSQPAKESNPALDACLEKRLGDVQTMLEDGILNESQFEKFSERATALCHSQNPG